MTSHIMLFSCCLTKIIHKCSHMDPPIIDLQLGLMDSVRLTELRVI